jgi:DNA replication protein DnaD
MGGAETSHPKESRAMEEQTDYTTEAAEALELLHGQQYDSLVRDEGPHDFFCQIPNLVDDYGLSPQAYRLYGHLRRVAGENGKCWQNTRTLAAACSMSTGSVSNAKKELETTEFIPFIRIRPVPTKTGFSYDEITLTDLWKLNHDIYSKSTVQNMNGSEYERLVHNMKQRISLIKNIPPKTEREKETEGDAQIFKALEQITGGGLNSDTPRLVDTWKEKHSLYWILRAVAEAKRKGARSAKYVDEILITWEANGYPKTREQRVQEKTQAGNHSKEEDRSKYVTGEYANDIEY